MIYILEINEDNYTSFKEWVESKKIYNKIPNTLDFKKKLFACIDGDYSIFFYEDKSQSQNLGYNYITLEELILL